MSTIPASQIDNVNPGVIGVGGTNFAATGLVLTQSTRVPVGTVLSFGSAAAVQTFFGAGSLEARIAGGGTGLGTGYFGGFTGATQTPGSILFAQYNQGAVAAYLRGGNISALTIPQLQAISGSLNIVFDGAARNAGAVNLSAATSFSSAAGIIQTALNAAITSAASVTGSIAAGTASFTASIAGQLMTVSAMTSGSVQIGGVISGTGVTGGTTVTGQISGTVGGIGVYTVSVAQTVASTAISETFGTMTVTAVSSGTLSIGQTITGGTTSAGTIITALGTGTGGTGTYIVNNTQTVVSGTLTGSPTAVAVTFDSVSGAFVITSGIVGPASTAAFATGTISGTLLLTSATGAVVSQGAGGAVQAPFMNALVTQNSAWANFMTAFDPDGGVGNLQKQAFAAWKNTQNARYGYVCWDLDPTPRASLPASSSLGQILAANGDSGTCLISEVADSNFGAFILGSAASINFQQANGRPTFAFKAQAGLIADVTDPTTALNLGGNPQVVGSFGNNYNFYGAYAQGNNAFTWFQRGVCTGPFLWFDSYVVQIWLNAQLQGALLTLQQQALSVPFNAAGAAQIEQALSTPIANGLSFGAFAPGTLSASEAAAVNAQASANAGTQVNVSNAIATQGYYLQIVPASPTVRANRGPWAITFWYLDRQSVQSINLSSTMLV